MNNTRVIRYIPKITTAKTHYREIGVEDMTWLQSQLILWLAQCSELQQRRDSDSEEFVRHWWCKRNTTMPRGQHGPNSPQSFVGGMVNNLVYGTQRDLSDRQMDAVQHCAAVISQWFPHCEHIRFQLGFE